VDVILLPSNRPRPVYRGGQKITEFRGEPPAGDRARGLGGIDHDARW
jgi:hypothetical protein